uniref:Reverse transcriptase domain-containing protein n=1 Tax=Tanacetum cinerariifolium TaxID=118510 RepID=A0A6L2NMT3_TANCI|nr:hypothetical protein [Tanacetum cinerariifolium]
MSADSAVTYTSVHSEARSWSIPSEDPYEEDAQQLLEQASRSPEYVPDPIELEDHVPVHIPEHPKDLVPAEDEAPIDAYILEELEEILVTHSPDFQNTFEPSNASTSVVNAPREPYVVKQDNESSVDKIIFYLKKAPYLPNQFHCFHCKDVLRDGEACKRCTCAKCGSGLGKGFCYICGHNQNSLNDSPIISETSSQSPPNINHCCYECVPVISILEPCNNQTIDELPQALSIFHPTFHSEAESPFTLDSTPTYVDDLLTFSTHIHNLLFTPTEPVDSLSMGDEHLNTILATESDEFIKSCVENLVPNPSESGGENGCDVPTGFTTFSNVLVDDDYDSDSSDDKSLFVEDVREKIYSNPLFDEEIIPMEIDPHSFNAESDLIEPLPNHDSSVNISSKIDSLFDEFAGELTILKSFPLGIDETDCHPEKEIRLTKRLLYDNSSPRPPKEIVSDISNADIESFSPSPIPNEDSNSHMEEIDLSFNPDDPMSSSIEDDDYDSERDIPILDKLLDNYSISLPTNESYHFDIPSPYRPPAKPPDGNT